jgi:hypothetical protein
MEMDQREAARLLREDHNSKTRLLSLPPEIRNTIFEMVAEADTFESHWIPSSWSGADHSIGSVDYIENDHSRIEVPRPKVSLRDAWRPLDATAACRTFRNELTSVIWSKIHYITIYPDHDWTCDAAKAWIENTPFQRSNGREKLDVEVDDGEIRICYVAADGDSPRKAHEFYSYGRYQDFGCKRAEAYVAAMNQRPADHVITKRDIQTLVGYLIEESTVQRTKRRHKEFRLQKKRERNLWISHGRRDYLEGGGE